MILIKACWCFFGWGWFASSFILCKWISMEKCLIFGDVDLEYVWTTWLTKLNWPNIQFDTLTRISNLWCNTRSNIKSNRSNNRSIVTQTMKSSWWYWLTQTRVAQLTEQCSDVWKVRILPQVLGSVLVVILSHVYRMIISDGFKLNMHEGA